MIFNLAGQVSHIDSMRDPVHRPRHQLPRAAVDAGGLPPLQPRRAGSSTPARGRSTAGRIGCRWTRHHLVRPADINGVNKAAGEYYHLLYNNVFGVHACVAAADQRLRPAAADQAQSPGLHRLVHPARDRGARDSDLRRRFAAARLRLRGRCRGCVPARRRDRRLRRRGLQRRRRSSQSAIAIWCRCCSTSPASGSVRYVEWPPEKKRIDIGSFYSDSTKFRQHRRAGRRRVDLREGLARTVAFYREHCAQYLDAPLAAEESRR